MGDLSFQKFAKTVRARADRWFPIERWSGSDWATALAGETGEVCDVVKKLNRADVGRPGKNDPPREELMHELGREIADVITYANLLAQRYGVDVAEACVKKFNDVSLREGFPERLELSVEHELEPKAVHPAQVTVDVTVTPEAELKPPTEPPAATPDDLQLRLKNYSLPREKRAVPRADVAKKPKLRVVKDRKEPEAKKAPKLRKKR